MTAPRRLALASGLFVCAALLLPCAQAQMPVAAPAAASESPQSPRAALRGYFDAARAGHWEAAARYLAPAPADAGRAADLARQLKGVIDAHHWLELDTISGNASGRLDDGLPAEIEEVYRLSVNGRVEALRMTPVNDAEGAHWAFTPQTVARIDAWYRALPDHWLRELLQSVDADVLLLPGPFEFLWWQWVALTVLTVASWTAAWFAAVQSRRWLVRVAARRAAEWDAKFAACLTGPLVIVWATNLFWLGAHFLVLTDPARRSIATVATTGVIIAVFWALWSFAGVFITHLLQQTWTRQNASARTLILVGGNLVRSALLLLGVLAVLNALGYAVSSLIAGLGIGGLAVAFGAQKAIENLFGSITLAIDQPFRVGDFVRIDDQLGTIEHIGLRSTQLRTLDRTLVTFPNGMLAVKRIESLQARDRMRLSMTLALEIGTTRDKVDRVLMGVEAALRDQPFIWSEEIVVRFAALSPSSLDIEVMAWFEVDTWQKFRDCRQAALLAFLAVVEHAGARLALPSRTLFMEGPRPAPADISA